VPDQKIILEVLKIIGLITTQQRGKVVGMSMTVMEFSYVVVWVLSIGWKRCLSWLRTSGWSAGCLTNRAPVRRFTWLP